MIEIPTTLGKNNADQAHDRVVKLAKSLRPMAGTGTQVTRSAFGMVFNGNARNISRAVKVLNYQITALVGMNYFKAQLCDDSGNLSGADEFVSKCYTGQIPACGFDTIDTFQINYTGSDGDNNRTATAEMLGSEVQVCHPRYQVGDLIVVIQILTGAITKDAGGNNIPMVDTNGNQITLYELSPERFWCSAPDDFTPPGS